MPSKNRFRNQALSRPQNSRRKTKREAIRCLKRDLARHIWALLYQTPQPPIRTEHSLAEKPELANVT
jgi:hypothetical protein